MSPSLEDRVVPREHLPTEKLPSSDPFAASPTAETLNLSKDEVARHRAAKRAAKLAALGTKPQD